MADSALTTECRLQPRYKLSLELYFSYRRGTRIWHGTGRTRDFSDKVICFESDHELPGGVQLELRIAWPIALQGLFPLEMVVHGTLVRSQSNLAVLRLDEFELRTQGAGSFHEHAIQGDLCNVLA